MSDVIIVGAGGHAAEIAEYIRYAQITDAKYALHLVGLIDDDPTSYARYQYDAPFLGTVESHTVRNDVKYVIGIASLDYRKSVVDSLLAQGAQFTSAIHPSSYISSSASIGTGVVIGPNVNVGPNVIVGEFNLLNARCSLAHDTRIGDYNFVGPNVCFSGFTVVGDNNLFGINAATIPGIKIGHNNKIAAGMVLNKNVGNDEVIFYRYKEKVVAAPR